MPSFLLGRKEALLLFVWHNLRTELIISPKWCSYLFTLWAQERRSGRCLWGDGSPKHEGLNGIPQNSWKKLSWELLWSQCWQCSQGTLRAYWPANPTNHHAPSSARVLLQRVRWRVIEEATDVGFVPSLLCASMEESTHGHTHACMHNQEIPFWNHQWKISTHILWWIGTSLVFDLLKYALTKPLLIYV